jgi:N-acetyl-anhydromuramyl-L-alanine amidase AmpD
MAVPAEWTPSAASNQWRWIVIHHSATPAGGAKAFDKMHKAKGWDELGYHFVVGNGTDTRDGQVEVGPRWSKQKWGAHAKTSDNRFNRFGIGICLVGNFDNERPTKAQLASLSKLVAFLMKTYNVPADRVIGHGETKATDCPGRNVHIADIRRMATAQLAAAGDAIPASEAPVAKAAAAKEMLSDLRK